MRVGPARVATRVRSVIEAAELPPEFADLLRLLMARPEFATATGKVRWPSFVLDTCHALGGPSTAAIGAAAAVEFAICAVDVADDLIDHEWDEQHGRWERALNASLALTALAQVSASQIAEAVGDTTARRVTDLVMRYALQSLAGQDHDLRLETVSNVTEEQALEMTRRKSGSCLAMACEAGAALSSDDPGVLAAVARFGEKTGVLGQLLNDMAGAIPDATGRASDVRRRKKSLPIAYALKCARDEQIEPLLEWERAGAEDALALEPAVARLIHDLGALHYTWVVAELHRQEAIGALEELSRLTGRPAVTRLQRLIPRMRRQLLDGKVS
jgi:geranylgeranyl pyrophosphate synthase